MNGIDIEDGVAIPLISGWVDRVKALFPERYWGFMPIVSILVGVAYALFAKPGYATLGQRVVLGAYLGLSASGLFAACNHWKKAKEAAGAKV